MTDARNTVLGSLKLDAGKGAALPPIMYQDLIGIPYQDGGRMNARQRTASGLNEDDLSEGLASMEQGTRGAPSRAKGVDCWGLLLEMGRRLGIAIPDVWRTREDARVTQRDFGSAEACRRALFGDWEPADLGPGVVVVFADVDEVAMHVGVMVSARDFIHATKRVGVLIQRIDRAPWVDKLLGVYEYHGAMS